MLDDDNTVRLLGRPHLTNGGSVLNSSRCRARVGAALLGVLMVFATLGVVPAQAVVPTAADSQLWGVDGRVRKIVQTDNAIYLAGLFNNLVGPNGELVPRTNLAALDPTTGAPLPFNPRVNGQVWGLAISPDGSSLYVGGDFFKVGGIFRKRVAKVDAVTGAVASDWDPQANARVEALATNGPLVYLGGAFTALGTTPRTRLAALSATTGAPDPVWTATADALVHDMEMSPDGTRLLIGGAFNRVSGSAWNTQRRLASLDPVTGALQAWTTHPSYEIFDLAVSHTQVFAAAGGAGGHAMAYRLSDGLEHWSGISDGDCTAVGYQNGVVYVGGHFTAWGGVAASHMVALDAATGNRLSWTIRMNSNLGVFTVNTHGGHLVIGGDFTYLNGLARKRIARFSEAVDVEAPSVPGTPSGVSNSPTAISLVWAASTDNAATTLTYQVFRDGGTVPIGQVGAAAGYGPVTFEDTGLRPGTTHHYQLRADDGENYSALSPVSAAITVQSASAPILLDLWAKDADLNAKVDTIEAVFSDPVFCTGNCSVGWSLSGFPGGTAIDSVSVSGDTATVTLVEGSIPKTDVGGAKVALSAPASKITDADGDVASFSATKPGDLMAPLPLSIVSANGGTTPGLIEVNDTFSVTFSEPLNPGSVIPANVKLADPTGVGNDSYIIVGLTDSGMDLGTDSYLVPDKGTIIYEKSTLTVLDSNRTVKSTIVGTCTGTACTQASVGIASPVTFVPEPFLRDPDGNHAAGSLTVTLQMY